MAHLEIILFMPDGKYTNTVELSNQKDLDTFWDNIVLKRISNFTVTNVKLLWRLFSIEHVVEDTTSSKILQMANPAQNIGDIYVFTPTETKYKFIGQAKYLLCLVEMREWLAKHLDKVIENAKTNKDNTNSEKLIILKVYVKKEHLFHEKNISYWCTMYYHQNENILVQ